MDSSSNLHLYIDGQDQGVAAKNVRQPCFAVFNIFDTVIKVRILDVIQRPLWLPRETVLCPLMYSHKSLNNEKNPTIIKYLITLE